MIRTMLIASILAIASLATEEAIRRDRGLPPPPCTATWFAERDLEAGVIYEVRVPKEAPAGLFWIESADAKISYQIEPVHVGPGRLGVGTHRWTPPGVYRLTGEVYASAPCPDKIQLPAIFVTVHAPD